MLVFEKPKTCGGCPCMNMRGGFVCQEEWRDVEDPDHVPMWCPLRPLPQRIEQGYPTDDYTIGKADGWNACLAEITGETE